MTRTPTSLLTTRFNPRLPGGRRPPGERVDICEERFNPRLPGGRRLCVYRPKPRCGLFQSTPSGGKATPTLSYFHVLNPRFNPRLPGGRRPSASPTPARTISSFNPRLPGGRRRARVAALIAPDIVSIHAFRGEGDPTRYPSWVGCQFQSTPSGGKATLSMDRDHNAAVFQSTPSGGKATINALARRKAWLVSIHAFRGEGDEGRIKTLRISKFQSTPSGGKATAFHLPLAPAGDVSIHAFRGEGDQLSCSFYSILSSFNPRLPGGRRRIILNS